MNQTLRRFINRAPRYVLRPNDRHIVRYMPDQTGPTGINKTTLLNISETGLAITVDAHAAPTVGERMKVELPVPGGEQIAWWAIVVRTELVTPNWWSSEADAAEERILVALKFEELP